jgi:acyl carrier protein
MTKFEQIASDILHLDPSQIRDNLTAKDVPDWDSMNYLLFIAELEKQYATRFTMNEVLSAQTLGDVKNLLMKKGLTL